MLVKYSKEYGHYYLIDDSESLTKIHATLVRFFRLKSSNDEYESKIDKNNLTFIRYHPGGTYLRHACSLSYVNLTDTQDVSLLKLMRILAIK